MSGYYKLVGHDAVPCVMEDWAETFTDTESRRVALTAIGGSEVSTVFLGLNHNHRGGPPLLFETMIFGGPLDQEQDRCGTWDEAVALHERMCQRVRSGETEP